MDFVVLELPLLRSRGVPRTANETPLVDRRDERTAPSDLVGLVRRGMSAAMVLRGEPGVGKSALLAYASDVAGDIHCLWLAGVESEAHLHLAGLHRLLVRHLDEIDTLPDPQQQALQVALGRSAGLPPNLFLLGLATLTLLSRVARQSPLLCLVDDAQRLDAETSEVLAFVARRLHAEAVGIVLAVREPTTSTMLAGIPDMTLSNLDCGSAMDLLLRLADGRVDHQVARRLAEESDGNPLVLFEIGQELAAGRIAPAVGSSNYFQAQVEALPAESRTLLLLAAADPGVDPSLTWRAAETLGVMASAAIAAEERRLIELTPVLRFRHPLIRSAVYHGASPESRRHVHRALATAPRARTDPQLRAWHLAHAASAPDEEVATELVRSARVAGQRGGFLTESAFLIRAAELSPDSALAASRRLGAAEAALTGGAPLQTLSLLDSVKDSDYGPLDRAKAGRTRTHALITLGRGRAEAPASLMNDAISCSAADGALARAMLLEAVVAAFVAGNELAGVTAPEIGRVALSALGDPGSADLRGPDLLLAGSATLLSVGYVEAVPLLRRAVTALDDPACLADGVPVWLLAGTFAANILWDDRGGMAWLTRCGDVARRSGALRPLILALTGLSVGRAVRGQLQEAENLTSDVWTSGRKWGASNSA